MVSRRPAARTGRALATASSWVCACSLASRLFTYPRLVCTLMLSRRLIVRASRPAASRRSTSPSRGVRSTGRRAPSAGRARSPTRWVGGSVASRLGGSASRPARAVRTVRSASDSAPSLDRKPHAPAAAARTTKIGSECAVSTTTHRSGRSRTRRAVSSSPSSPPSRASITTTSGGQPVDHLGGLGAVRRPAHAGQVGLGLQRGAQQLGERAVVVDDQDPAQLRRRGGAHLRRCLPDAPSRSRRSPGHPEGARAGRPG